MEFDEMKKIWDAQNNQPLYVMDENALYKRIQSKMNSLLHVTSTSELGLIVINLFTGIVLIARNSFARGPNIFLIIEAAWENLRFRKPYSPTNTKGKLLIKLRKFGTPKIFL